MPTNLHREQRESGPVRIQVEGIELTGDLVCPPNPVALVLFAHGSGSSRRSSRNQAVARVLNQNGLATLLFDLLTEDEERSDSADGHLRFDIPLLATRLLAATHWIRNQELWRQAPVGFFGSSTGAAAALMAAAEMGAEVGAVVSRGGRADLAGAALASVQSPTLLIVGGEDTRVLSLNEEAASRLRCANRLVVIPGATHLFEEPGTLDTVARLAAEWFTRHLSVHHVA